MSIRIIALTMAAFACGALPATAIELKDITYSTDNAGKVVFSHKSHLNKKKPKSAGFDCRTCHDKGTGQRGHGMAAMERGTSCGACHNGTRAFSVTRCTACHKVRDIVFKVKETGPVAFSHDRHLKAMQCGACHNAIYRTGANGRVSMAGMKKGKSCGACHNGTRAFAIESCTRCHPARDRSYRVANAGVVTFSHPLHMKMYGCGDCHSTLYKPGRGNRTATMGDMRQGGSCGVCHDGTTAFSVQANCAQCHKIESSRTAALSP
jgi:c(7)-type cytochrome triheme protein